MYILSSKNHRTIFSRAGEEKLGTMWARCEGRAGEVERSGEKKL